MKGVIELTPEAIDIIGQKMQDCLSGELSVCFDGHDFTELVLQAIRDKSPAPFVTQGVMRS